MVLGEFCFRAYRSLFCSGHHRDESAFQQPSLELDSPGRNHENDTQNRSAGIHRQAYVGSNVVTMDPRVFDTLKNHSALGALYNSAERTHAPRCHPGTRIAVLEDVVHWLKHTSCQRPLLVITGAAGTGKSAIMQTLAEKLHPSGELAATYFATTTLSESSTFDQIKQHVVKNESKGHSDFVATLAFQIASRYPTVRPLILGAVEGNPAIFTTSLSFQLDELIRQPVVAAIAHSPLPGRACCIMVDGIDECGSDENQTEVIYLLQGLASDPNLPFRVVISSRPEFPIRSALSWSLSSAAYHLELDISYDPEADIELFAREELRRIQATLLPRIPEESWPSEFHVSAIRTHSSGHFIFAATALKYVDNRHYDPRTRLDEVLQWCDLVEEPLDEPREDRGNNSPLRSLDTLYTNIVMTAAAKAFPDSDCSSRARDLLLILGQIQLLNAIYSPISTLRTAEDFMFFEHGRITRILDDLHSLVSVGQSDDNVCMLSEIVLHHQSFGDFIYDPRRSGHLSITESDIVTSLSVICTKHLLSATASELHQALVFNNADNTALPFAMMYWIPLLEEADLSPELVNVLCKINLRVWEELAKLLDTWELFVFQRLLCIGTLPNVVDRLHSPHFSPCRQGVPKRGRTGKLLTNLENIAVMATPCAVCKDPELIRHQAQWAESERWDDIHDGYTHAILETPCDAYQGAILSARWNRLDRDLNEDIERDADAYVERVQAGFIVGSPFSGKTSLLKAALAQYGFPVDPYLIVIKPTCTGVELTLSILAPVEGPEGGEPCGSRVKEFARIGDLEIFLSSKIMAFDFFLQAWRLSFPNLPDHCPLFLVEDFHILSPSLQLLFLERLMVEMQSVQASDSESLRVVVASRPVGSLAKWLEQQPGPGVYYINLDVSYRAFSLIENWLWTRLVDANPLPEHEFPRPSSEQIYAIAQRLARSQKRWYYATKLVHYVVLKQPSFWEESITTEAPLLFKKLDDIPFAMTDEYSEHIRRLCTSQPWEIRQLC